MNPKGEISTKKFFSQSERDTTGVMLQPKNKFAQEAPESNLNLNDEMSFSALVEKEAKNISEKMKDEATPEPLWQGKTFSQVTKS